MSDFKERARTLANQHESGDLLVMPTVWDTFSAALAADAGFASLTIGSHPVADSIGSADGEKMDFADYLAVVQRITSAVDVPVSADVESGYGLSPQELFERVFAAGAVGVNIEDVVHREGKRVRARQEHADYIHGVRAAADAAGVDFVINGRTDAVKLTEHFADPLAEAIERIKLLEQAGARSVYPVALSTADQVEQAVQAVSIPVNVTAHPVTAHAAGDLSALRKLGVRRVSFGPLWQKWMAEVSSQQLSAWRQS
ncbi:phosphonomutase [Glutamicibacter halophytocola]|uniref:isocitrate lyase/PEP mutase family protein n=1 Tax=Glutamicibacter halophytocola TaxID=1933880 RepID=UPI0006D4AC79|nr:isocitrate lyase/phosphoenolpyruvate mutase family protein [Glutamicibacter halophytocola]ALG29494.1 phosphonomutase [Glutamicibacter halophytocola]